MRRFANTGDYMPIENAYCLNLVTAVIDFYKRQPKRLKTIFLDHQHWKLFIEDLKKCSEDNPGFVPNALEGVPIADSDVTVKRGSQFQKKEMQYEFYKDAELKQISGQKMAEC